VQLYPHPRDWKAIAEARVTRNERGDLNLATVQLALGAKRPVRVSLMYIKAVHWDSQTWNQVIDPKNYHPLAKYNEKFLEASNIKNLMRNGVLCFVEESCL
jgi:hypothetical protein